MAQNQAGDWADHTTGHELFVTLSNEMDTLFVILFFKDMINNPRQIKVNDDSRKELDSLVSVSHPGVVYTEVDMSNSNRNAYTYERLASKQLGLNLRELEYGPIAVVMQGGVGSQVVFKGNYQDFMDTVDQTIHSVNADQEKEIDKVAAREEALKLAKNGKLDKAKGNFNYYRPTQYSEKDTQTRDRYGTYFDPTYNENPVAVGKGKF